MDLVDILKIVFIFVILAEGYICGIAPAKCEMCLSSPLVLSLMNAFSGGVFIAVAIIHVLPEAVEDYTSGYKPEEEHKFPLPYFLVFCGYTLILILDKVLFYPHALIK